MCGMDRYASVKCFLDKRILLALSLGTKSSVTMRTFTEDNLNGALQVALDSSLNVGDGMMSEAKAPKILSKECCLGIIKTGLTYDQVGLTLFARL